MDTNIVRNFQKKLRRKMEYEEVSGIDERTAISSNTTHYNSSHGGDNRTEINIPPDIESRQLQEVEQTSGSNMIGINAARQSRFYSDVWKAFIAFLILVASSLTATLSLALTHDRLPDRDIYQPLPDIVLDNVTNFDFVLKISEIQIMLIVNTCIILVIFHKHRLIIMRRCFFMMSILYFYRSITIYVTVLPISSKTYYCSPKSNSTLELIERALKMFIGMGLSINGQQKYCGDSIFSGHSTILILGYMVISEYSPKRFKMLHHISLMNAVIGIILLLIAHAHYTIDVIIAYYVTTRLFWSYHSMCNQNLASSTSVKQIYFVREWWFIFFRYFEHPGRTLAISNELEVPWPFKCVSEQSDKQ